MKLSNIALFTVLFFSTFLVVKAQEKQILFSVEDTPVYASEFKRVYKKNLELVKDENQKDVDNYLDLFIKYKLKIAEAKQLGLDKKPAYLREFEGYKKQLSTNFLSNNQVTEALVKEAYERLKYEVNARHILVRIDENAPESQVKLAEDEINKLRDRVITEGYDAVKSIHNGRTLFAEELGFFTAFKMVYNFETAAYQTAIGEWSQPFRTRFGFHIVNVLDKRENRGTVTVAHIMLTNNNEDKAQDAEQQITEIYKRIKQGESFEALAKQFSQDKSSSSNGGKLNPFSSGQLSSPIFEEQAFSLETIGQISEPFKSKYGFHIVKLLDRKTIDTYQNMEAEIKAQVKKDSRSSVISESRYNNLLSKYNVTVNNNDLDYFTSILNNQYYKRIWQAPKTLDSTKVLFTLGDTSYKYSDFAKYLENSQRKRQAQLPFNQLVSVHYRSFLEAKLIKYQEENLEFENEEYANILNEYRDGLLLFDLMETKIWNAAREDSLGLKNYFEANKQNYYFDKKLDVVIASSANKKDIKTVAKLLEQNKDIAQIKNQLNTEDEVNVSFIVDKVTLNHQALPSNFKAQQGVSKLFKHNNAYSVVKVNSIIPKQQKTFEEAKGKVISDFQELKEKQWLENLSKTYKVTINQDVLKQVKKDLN